MTATVRDLRASDLPHCGWAGSTTHLRAVRAALDRVPGGGVGYLLVLDEDGTPVAMGGIDYDKPSGVPTLWQLGTDPQRRSQGFGTALIAALEEQARARGHRQVRLDVETDNVRARRLYERLGYRATGAVSQEEWDQELPDGRVTRYCAECIEMIKDVDGVE